MVLEWFLSILLVTLIEVGHGESLVEEFHDGSSGFYPLTNPPIPIRGVNLGGWLILEDWMTPNLFTDSGIPSNHWDQYHFDQLPNARLLLQEHWSTFITESDFDDFASWGINAVRIPIGYWAYAPAHPYISGADSYLEKALLWARERGMGAIIDLHGLPGSQNGFANSGHKMNPWDITWQTEENLELSIMVLKLIASKYANDEWSDVVRAIELVNEPIVYGANSKAILQAWVQAAYNAVAKTATNDALFIITHDAFLNPWDWYWVRDNINDGPHGGRFILDTHAYQNKGGNEHLTQNDRVEQACALKTHFLDARKNRLPMIVGEWTIASSFCMSGSTQYPGHSCGAYACNCTGDPDPQWCGDYDADMFFQVKRYGEVQRRLWEAYTQGWFMWSAKAQGAWGLNTSLSSDCQLMGLPLYQFDYEPQCPG